MENDIPQYILREMEMIGIMPKELPEDVPDEPKIPRQFEFNMPDLDENGEPPW